MKQILGSLKDLGILKGSGSQLWIHEGFCRNFLRIADGELYFACEEVPEQDRDRHLTLEKKHAWASWRHLLQVLVDPPYAQTDSAAKSLASKLLVEGKFLEWIEQGEGKTLSITSEGFRFLLLSPCEQAWILLQIYSTLHPASHSLFTRLGFFSSGFLYKASEYSSETLRDLHMLGFIHLYDKDRIFTPTVLSLHLTDDPAEPFLCNPDEVQTASSGKTLSSSSTGTGFLVLETNYKLYAYTRDPLQLGILGLFVQMRGVVGGHLSYGLITHESCRNAYERGIASEQLIHYLTVNAHPEMHRRLTASKASIVSSKTTSPMSSSTATATPPNALLKSGFVQTTVLPPNVLDQMRIWEKERRRFDQVIPKCILYTDFSSKSEFDQVRRHFDEHWVYIEDRRMILIAREEETLAANIRDFIRSIK